MSRNLSAKDIAFEKERARLRREYNEKISKLQKELKEKEEEINTLQLCLEETEEILREKEDWIDRLLEYMDIPKEEFEAKVKNKSRVATLSKGYTYLVGNILEVLQRYE